MTKPLLIWQPDIFPDEEREIAAKYFRVEEFKLSTHNYGCGSPFAMRGAVATATRLGHNLSRFDCRNWVPHLHQYMISKNFWWQIADKVLSKDFYKLFIRPDSCKKLFAGQLFSQEKWKEELSFLKQRNGEKILVFCAEQQWIGREWRCLFVGQELVGVSDYMFDILPALKDGDSCR